MMVGRHTAATKAAISAALRGRPRPPEVRAKIAATKTGKKRSPEECMSMRVAQRVIKLFKPELYEAQRERGRALMRANWQDPAFLERWQAGRETYRRKMAAIRAPKPDPRERWEQMASMRAQGMTLKEIGVAFGIRYQRVAQILKKLSRSTTNDGEGDGVATRGLPLPHPPTDETKRTGA